MKWANDTLRQLQSNPPWVGWVSDETKQQFFDAGWKEVADNYELPRDLILEKLSKRQQINAAKDAAESASPFIYMEKPFDFDPLSRERLNVAIQLAQSLKITNVPGNTVIENWKLYDNTNYY